MKLFAPPVPILTPIPGRLFPGSKITIVGCPLEKCQWFLINLKMGSADEEIALHISVRFKPFVRQNMVVRNAWTSVGWGQEEKNTPHFPFVPKKSYKIEILCEKVRYRIFIDDIQLGIFTHRLPLAYVDHIEVKGETELTLIEFPSIEYLNITKSDVNKKGKLMNNLSIKDDDDDDN